MWDKGESQFGRSSKTTTCQLPANIKGGETSIWTAVKINLSLFVGRKTVHKVKNLFIKN